MIAQTESLAGRAGNTPLAGIESLCAEFDEQSAKLESLITDLESDLEAVKQKHLGALKRQAAVVARRQAELESAIEAAPALFIKPRSFTLHGIKVGLTYTEGKLVFDDAETVVKLIKKFRKEDAATFIRTKEEPNKDALWTLDKKDLAALGCRIEDTGDVVVCKRVAGDVEKLIKKLIEKLVEAMVSQD
jgi:hypothetical protein